MKKRGKAWIFGYAGAPLIAAAMLAQCRFSAGVPILWMRAACILLAVALLALEIYLVFFAVRLNGGSVVDTGLYGYCRHPGFWTFFLISAYMIGGLGLRISVCLFANALNFFLILFEDVFAFPKMIDGYMNYKERVGFLTPKRTE